MIQWSQKSLQFQVFSYHCAAYEYRNDTVVCCMPFYMAAFPYNRAKQSVRTLRVLFALAALSRRPLLWPATVLRILNSGRPKPGPTTQNKSRELDPKGSHDLLCAYLEPCVQEKSCFLGSSVQLPALVLAEPSLSGLALSACQTLGHGDLAPRAYI